MKTKRRAKKYTMFYVAALILIMSGAQQYALADSEPVAAAEGNAQLVEAQAAAKEILMRMAEFMAKIPQYSVNLTSNYDVLQESGQMIEFGESRTVILSRPNGLRVEVEQSDGEKHLFQYDGKEITLSSPSQNVYAQTSRPGGIDEAVMYFLRDLGMRLPLAMLLTSRIPAEIDRRTQSLNYVEETVIDGIPVHHLAGRTETVDYQAWIPEGGQPLPLRIVLTYKDAEGHPAFRAQFSDWNMAPEVKDSLFAFTPSEGMQKIPFLAELPKIALEGPINPEQTGESK